MVVLSSPTDPLLLMTAIYSSRIQPNHNTHNGNDRIQDFLHMIETSNLACIACNAPLLHQVSILGLFVLRLLDLMLLQQVLV